MEADEGLAGLICGSFSKIGVMGWALKERLVGDCVMFLCSSSMKLQRVFFPYKSITERKLERDKRVRRVRRERERCI